MDWRDRLRLAIDRSGMKHSIVAMDAGINPATLSRILNGHMQPRFETVARIAIAADVQVGWLLQEHGYTLSADEVARIRAAVEILRPLREG